MNRHALLVFLLASACATAPPAPVGVPPTSSLPYFAPGVITIPEATTYRPSFDPMNQEVVFTAEVGPDYVMARSLMSRSGWLRPELLSFSGKYSDAEGFISPDGTTMVFSSKRPVSGTEQKRDYDLWITTRSGDGWDAPRRIDVLSGETNELYPALASDATLYFMRAESEGNDLWRAELVDGAYQAAVKLPSPPNSDNRDAGVYIAADESFMLLDSNRPGGLGGTDIWISFRSGELWSAPKNLGIPFNSPANETSAMLSPDMKRIYVTSSRRAPEAPSLGTGATFEQLMNAANTIGTGKWHILEYEFDASKWK